MQSNTTNFLSCAHSLSPCTSWRETYLNPLYNLTLFPQQRAFHQYAFIGICKIKCKTITTGKHDILFLFHKVCTIKKAKQHCIPFPLLKFSP